MYSIGGTTDITVHQKLATGVKELDKSCGCDIGGRSVDKEMMKTFDRFFQGLIQNVVKCEKTTEYLGLYKEFEDVKKSITPDRTGDVRIPLPCRMLETYCNTHLHKTIDTVVKDWNNTEGNISLQICDDRLIVSADDLKSLFAPSIDKIIKTLSEVVQKNEDISLIILVGGFAECQIFSEKVKQCFKQKIVIVPEHANLAILKGAVLFGHNSDVINPRITRYTYGTECVVPFEKFEHDVSRKILDGWGNECCKGIFSLIIKQKESIALGKVLNARYNTTERYQSVMALKIITSEDDSPLYTDGSSCRFIGELKFMIQHPSKDRRSVAVEYIFGDTEIKIKAVDVLYGNTEECFLDLVSK